LDAAEILSKVAPNGSPDLARFTEVIGEILAQAQRAAEVKESRIAVFGEMVALLLMGGDAAAAIQLEQFWNHLAATHSFTLRCAYPMAGFDRAELGDAFARICAEHDGVIPAESYTELSSEDDRLRRIAHLQQKAQVLKAEVAQRQEVQEELRRSHVELQQTSSALRESEERYRVLFRALPVAVFACDRDAVIQDYNQRAVELWGREPQCGVERHCGSVKLYLPNGVFLPHTQSPMVEVLRTGVPAKNVEVFIERPDGSRLPVIANFAALKNAQGEIIGAVTAFEDITERKRAEETLRRAHDKLEERVKERTAELESQIVERGRAEDSLRELTGRLLRLQDDTQRRIARELHDSVGQLLAALSMNIALVSAEKRLSPQAAKAVSDNAALVEQISREVRTISHLLHPPLLDEVGLLASVRLYLEEFARRSGMKVDLELAEDFGRLPRDIEIALFRVIQECLINIHRHSGSPTAAIRVSRSAAAVRVEVQDRGKGIPPQKLARMESAGSGVGLRGMRERVRQLGGELDIRSDDRGTLVIVGLPLTSVTSDAA
jgi:PAS domain S-box-containing protein